MTITRAGNLATEALTKALITLVSAGTRPRCGDPDTHDLWTSEHHEDRVVAARWCAGCPVLDPCRQAATANAERFGVWGGRDYTRRPGQPCTPQAHTQPTTPRREVSP